MKDKRQKRLNVLEQIAVIILASEGKKSFEFSTEGPTIYRIEIEDWSVSLDYSDDVGRTWAPVSTIRWRITVLQYLLYIYYSTDDETGLDDYDSID